MSPLAALREEAQAGAAPEPPPAAPRRGRSLAASRLLFPALGLLCDLFAMALCGWLMGRSPAAVPTLAMLQLGLLLAGGGLLALLITRVKRCLLEPLGNLREWARQIREGDMTARVPVPPDGELAELARDLNGLGEELQSLSQDMSSNVLKQSRRLGMKTRSLEILYELAASLNAARDLDDLLTRFLHTLRDVVDAHAATVRLLDENGQMRLVASVGLDKEFVESEKSLPLNRCLCGDALAKGEILCQQDIAQCAHGTAFPLSGHREAQMLAVPLRYQDKTLGVYNLFVDQPDLALKDEVEVLLSAIGRHLGMAIEKARLDKESQRLSIMQERTLLAHELHDSLAQTLASLRFQVKMLEETLGNKGDQEAMGEVLRIRNALEEANTELRELLAHFRAPMDKRGLLPAIEGAIERFRRQSGIAIFFQRQCQGIELNANQEMQVLRILQECLANIRKHSRAHTVRVLLRCDDDDLRHLLIEDDGIGMQPPDPQAHPGEQLGLVIMKERAKRLGGRLTIDSEPGEGTRVELTFRRPYRRIGEIPVRAG